MTVVLVALMGGLGATLRFLVDEALRRRHPLAGTYAVNALGSLLLGWIVARGGSPVWGVGFCGGFTTLSTASLQVAVRLLPSEGAASRWGSGLLHLVALLALCTATAWVGVRLAG